MGVLIGPLKVLSYCDGWGTQNVNSSQRSLATSHLLVNAVSESGIRAPIHNSCARLTGRWANFTSRSPFGEYADDRNSDDPHS